jgi:hypothetical protein
MTNTFMINDSKNQYYAGMVMKKPKKGKKKNTIPDDIPIIWVNIV